MKGNCCNERNPDYVAFPVPNLSSAFCSPVSFSFPLDDLRKTLPGAESLAGLSGEALRAVVTGLLGALAKDAEKTMNGEMVTVTARRVGLAANTSGTPRRCRTAQAF